MAYLHINGVQVITRQGGGLTHNETFGRRDWGPSGKYQWGRNHIGREWKFTTIPLPKADAIALADMINMRGDHWRFDVASASRPIVNGSTTEASFYSDKKRWAYSSSVSTAPVAQVESCFGADGALVYDKNGVAQRPWAGATGFVLCEPGTTNLLPADEANPEEYNGDDDDLWVVNAATLTTETNRYWTGAGCVKVVTGGVTTDGVRTGDYVASNSKRYVGSVYIRPGSGGETLQLSIQEVGGGSPGSTQIPITLPASVDSWTRFEVAHTTDATAGTLRIIVADPQASTFYVDGFQLEQQDTGPATGWIAGTTTRNAGDLQYDNLLTGFATGFTVSAWVKHLRTGLSTAHYVFDSGVGAGNTNDRCFFYFTSADAPNAIVRAFPAGANSDLSVSTTAPDNGWHHWVVVFDPATPKLFLYKDGVLVSSDTTLSGARLFDASTMTGDLHIGNIASGTTVWAPGPITHLSTFPFAASADFVSKLYNSAAGCSGGSPGLTPLIASGSFLGAGEQSVAVYGRVEDVTNVPHQSPVSGAWEEGGAQVSFTLMEATAR